MTSVSSNSFTPQATQSTNSSATSTHARTSSASGQNSSSAAVPASAPTARPASLSYASAVTSKKPPTGPGAAPSSSSTAQVSGGQHARSASTASAVNGKIQPAVPQIGTPLANGSATPYSGGQHSRKSSLAGNMPNGTPRAPNIKFGAINEPGTGPQPSGTAPAAGNLTAPVALNPSTSSPQSSPSPAVQQPVANSGGAPPQTGPATGRPIQFGDAATHHQPRPTSMPPVGPGSMGPQGHSRRDSTQSAHGEPGPPMPHGRGMTPANRGGRHQPYSNQYQGQYPSYGQGRGGYAQGPNMPRNGPPMPGPAPQYHQQYPNSPSRAHRSPAMTHASPSMSHVVPNPTPQLYPPTGQPYIPGSPHFPQMQPAMYDYGYPQGGYSVGYQYPMPQTSPRPQFSQVSPSMGPAGYMPSYQTQAASMSRSSSANISDIHGPRPPSSMGQHPTPPTMTPQPQSFVSPPPPGTPGPPSPAFANRAKRGAKAIEIKNPNTGATIQPPKPTPPPSATAPVAPSAPVIVSSPSPAPGRSSSRNETHSRSTSRSNKTTDVRQELKDGITKRIEEAKREEERVRKEQEEKDRVEKEKKEEEERKAKEEAEAEERRKKEEEEKARKEAEDKARKEAEEKAQEEERKRKEEEAQVAKAKAEEEEEARLAKEKEEKEAREKAEQEQKAKEAEESKKAEIETKADAAPSTPVVTPGASKASTPDSESMPPPQSKGNEKTRSKPSPLNLTVKIQKTNEPALPSAALTALRSARPLDDIKKMLYPEGIMSPNPALNPAANGKFKYDKDFLMQFQNVFTDKPSVDWDMRMRETVGDAESARPGTARTPSGMGPRGSSSRGGPVGGNPPAMGNFGKPSGLSMGSDYQFPKTSRSNTNPLANLVGGGGPFARPGGPSTLQRQQSSGPGAIPQSPRAGSNRGSRANRKPAGGVQMEKTTSQQSQPTIPLADVAPLPVSANRWKPISVGSKKKEEEPTPGAEDDNRLSPELVQRKVKAALNKMTPEKFDKIADQILEITSQSKYETDGRTLRQVIQLTFEKATDEAAWSSMYAKFCKRMLETMDPNIKDENIRDKNDNVVTGGNLFRKYLLNRCQEEFERGWKVNLPPKPEGVSDEAAMLSDEYYIAAAAKRRGLGLVQFIGELYKLGMLTERIMNECVRKLLDFEGIPEDETVESLTKLLRTIGRQLDASERSRQMMEIYFTRINAMIDHKDLNSRMKFMLMDVRDLRSKGWDSNESDKGPKTIQEVRAEALKAQQEKEAQSRANRGSSRPQQGRGDARSFSSGFGMNPPYHENKTAGTVNADDLRKLNARQSRQVSAGPSSFGPSSMFTRSSSGGSRRGLGPGNSGPNDGSGPSSRTATPPAPASTSSANPFSLLSSSDNHANDSAEANDATSPPASAASSPPVANARLSRVATSNASKEESK